MRKKVKLRHTPDLSKLTPAQRDELDTRIADALRYIFEAFPPEGNNHERNEGKKGTQETL